MAHALSACGMWTPGAGGEPMSPESAGRLSTIGPSGESEIIALNEPHQCKGPNSY